MAILELNSKFSEIPSHANISEIPSHAIKTSFTPRSYDSPGQAGVMKFPEQLAILLILGVLLALTASATATDPCDCTPDGCPSPPKSGCSAAKNVLWLPLGDSITWGACVATPLRCYPESPSCDSHTPRYRATLSTL